MTAFVLFESGRERAVFSRPSAHESPKKNRRGKQALAGGRERVRAFWQLAGEASPAGGDRDCRRSWGGPDSFLEMGSSNELWEKGL